MAVKRVTAIPTGDAAQAICVMNAKVVATQAQQMPMPRILASATTIERNARLSPSIAANLAAATQLLASMLLSAYWAFIADQPESHEGISANITHIFCIGGINNSCLAHKFLAQ
jgi:hypothetical protein